LEDLRRAISQLDDDCWRDAARLASEFGADDAMGTGLHLVKAGVPLAKRLGLPWAPSAHSMLNWGMPWDATVWESLVAAATWRERAGIAAKFLRPSPDFMRQRSALARRGQVGLLSAYLVRLCTLATRAAKAFGPWRRARRRPYRG
jgi:hypothetical protein